MVPPCDLPARHQSLLLILRLLAHVRLLEVHAVLSRLLIIILVHASLLLSLGPITVEVQYGFEGLLRQVILNHIEPVCIGNVGDLIVSSFYSAGTKATHTSVITCPISFFAISVKILMSRGAIIEI
jgi:hypothetical protein